MNKARSLLEPFSTLTCTVALASLMLLPSTTAEAAQDHPPKQSSLDYVIKREVHGNLSVSLHEKFTIPVKDGASGVAWSSDGSILAVASQTVLATYTNSGHYLNGFHMDGHNGVFISPAFVNGDKQVLLPVDGHAKSERVLDVRDVATGEIVNTLIGKSLAEEFSLSPDLKRLAIAGGLGREVVTYDTETWKPLSTTTINHPKTGAVSLAFFPDNKRLAVGMGGFESAKQVAVVDSSSGTVLDEFKADRSKPYDFVSVDAVAVSPDGKLLLAGVDDATLRILRVSDGTEIATLAEPKMGLRRGQAVWDPKGRFVAVIDSNGLVVWQPQVPGVNFIKFRFSSPPEKAFSFDLGKVVNIDASGAFGLTVSITRNGDTLAVTHGDSVTVFNIESNV